MLISLLLALLHCVRLLLLVLLHLLLRHHLHHVHHHDGEADHEEVWVLHVINWVEWLLDVEVPYLVRWLQLQRVK